MRACEGRRQPDVRPPQRARRSRGCRAFGQWCILAGGARGDRRKCKCCLKFFRPDPRNRRHQRYCSAPRCRAASKAGSQARWLAKPENHDYFRGPINVARVRRWRSGNPYYWRRAQRRRPRADAVKAGRHPKHAARSLAYRPSLHGGEHGGRLDPLGRTIRSQLTQCPFSNRWFLTSFPPLLTAW